MPLILESAEYQEGGALFIIWDEAVGDGPFSDGPITMFVLSPFAKGGGKSPYSNKTHYDHSFTLKTLEEIFGVEPACGLNVDVQFIRDSPVILLRHCRTDPEATRAPPADN